MTGGQSNQPKKSINHKLLKSKTKVAVSTIYFDIFYKLGSLHFLELSIYQQQTDVIDIED
ncbi:hypothetical protein COO91_04158 [Nostoc flagelliforme CCNUN1]|uniref:Uncharacterized protein n=1 Tax=Nostoc flagelliforme CCNUN1 TaxID=2038116 RepID=A0A2K8SSA1_9NOSO|nr:hypothetical protein COO91_04158 [Nostoc flagelliforme CCNUN1]